MTDKERMDVVERCHSKMKRYRNLVSYYTNKNISCLLYTSEETNYRSSLSPFGIKMVDRLTGKPLHLSLIHISLLPGRG